jgi:Polyglycine hydrolase-like, structural repeat
MNNILFDLPFKGEDLKPGERYSRTKKIHTADPNATQHFAYDLQAKRWDAQKGRWTSILGNPSVSKNKDHVVYGKPVYAIADGEVTHAWRNAPDNPVVGEFHPDMDGIKISNAGNFLKVRNSEGEDILYAHFKPGSIPTSLCPFNGVLRNSMADSELPAGNKPSVKKGQLLGRVGNSGQSHGPHLHIHREKGGIPLPIKFRHGLATPLKGKQKDQADIDTWTRFAGEQIPPGPTLIWPPRSIVKEFARHKFPGEAFGRWFDHLADSGYWPKWIDGYSVGGQLFFNFIWTKAPGTWRGFFGQTSRLYQKRFDDAKKDGFAPVFVESYSVNNHVFYAVVFQKGKPGQWRAHHRLTSAEHEAVLDQAKADHLNPINISVLSVGGQSQYTVLYRADDIGAWHVKSLIAESDYQDMFEENSAAGRRPIYLSAYVHNNAPFLSAVFASKPAGAIRARHLMSPTKYQSEYLDAIGDGFSTQLVTSFNGAPTKHRYAAVWRKS